MTHKLFTSGRKPAGLALTFLLLGMLLALFDVSALPVANAATLTVNSTADTATAGDAQCTLREAINNVNAGADTTGGDCVAGAAGANTISFAAGGIGTITLTAALPTLTASSTTFGSAGNAATDTCRPTGPGGRGVPQVSIVATGFASAFNVTGNNNTLQGFVIGGATGAAIVLAGTGNKVVCNYIGTNAGGTAAVANATGISVTGGTNTIGGTTATDGNLISGNTTAAIDIAATATGTTILGNLIGTNLNGLNNAAAAIANQLGILVAGNNTTIGSNTTSQVLSGNVTFGIQVANGTALTTLNIVGNYIGTNPVNLALANAEGVILGGGTAVTVQNNFIQRNSGPGLDLLGTIANVTASGNTVSNNGAQGVIINSTGSNIRLSQNKIFTNGGLGIDATGNNTPDATPAAPNTAVPVITSAVWDGTKIQVKGTAVAGATVEVYFTDNPTDASGYGEGQYFVAATTANAAGNFDTGAVTLPAGVPVPTNASRVTATATPLTGANTSEFALNAPITLPPFTLLKAGVLSADGKRITWTILASNNNTLDITNASLTDLATPALPLSGTVTTAFTGGGATNTATVGTFPTGALTFSLAAGNSLLITYDVTVPTNAAPGAEFFNQVTVTASGVNGGAPFNSNIAKVRIPGGEKGQPADVVIKCKITPDREASEDEFNEIKLSCKLKNQGKGRAKALRLYIPIDISLVLGYALFSDPGIWVSEIVLTGPQPYIIVSMPDMDNSDGDGEAVIVFRPNKAMGSLKGKKVSLRPFAGWDDDDGPGKRGKGNGLVFVFGDSNVDVSGGDTQQFEQGNVTITLNQKIEFSSELFEPDEWVDFWVTKPDNTSLSLLRVRADANGKVLILFDTSGLGVGSYVFVGRGSRTEILLVSIIIIISSDGGGGGNGSPTPSVSPSASPSVSPSVSASPSASPSTTPSVSPSASPSATPTPTIATTPSIVLNVRK
jgi:CSLREA domain-containing protein